MAHTRASDFKRLTDERDASQAEVGRMRQVVEAACAIDEYHRGIYSKPTMGSPYGNFRVVVNDYRAAKGSDDE